VTVIFAAAPTLRITLRDETDEALEAALAKAEKQTGREFPRDPSTGFPEFTLYNARGEEVGQG
jgi:hypothetical protein